MPKSRLRSRLYAWWYLSIAVGFLLLATRHFLIGDKPWLIGLRVVIAIGFAALSYLEFRSV